MNNIVDILFGSSATYTFKKSNINNLVIELDILFSVADLSNIDNFKVTYPHNLFEDYDFSNEMNKLNDIVKDNQVRIWCSKHDSDSYIMMCYLCDYLKDKTSNIYLVYSEDYNKNYNTPAIISENEFVSAIELAHKLTNKEILSLADNYNSIKDSKNKLRLMKNGNIIIEDYDYFDDIITDILKDKKMRISSIVAKLLSNYDHMSDIIYCYIVQRLIEENVIEIVEENERFFNNVVSLKKGEIESE